MKALIIVSFGVFCICLLSACGGDSSAATAFAAPTHTSTPLPTPVPSPSLRPTPAPSPSLRPSLELEGQGSLTATGPCLIGTPGCPGIFTGKMSGPPFGVVDLTFNVFTDGTPLNPKCSGGCFSAGGNGQLNGGELTVIFTGTYCSPGICFEAPLASAGQETLPPAAFTYSLTGSVQIYTTQVCPTSSKWSAMSGTLNAFGEMHTSGPTPTPVPTPAVVNPFPPGPNDALVSIIGAAGQLPAPCPSP